MLAVAATIVQTPLPVNAWDMVAHATITTKLILIVLLIFSLGRDGPHAALRDSSSDRGSFADVFRDARFWRLALLGFSLAGGLIAHQSLWAGPQGAHRAWRADPCAVLRMVRPSCWPAPANPKID